MKCRMFWTLVFCSCFASLAPAQNVTGSGAAGTIPEFNSSTMIGNSPIVDFNGNIGIGTTTPDAALQVVNQSTSLTPFGLQPYAVYGSVANNQWFSSALRGDANGGGLNTGVIGVDVASNGEGGGGGVMGVTFSNQGFTFAVRGDALGQNGYAVGVLGFNASPYGPAGVFTSGAGGSILEGKSGPEASATMRFRVDARGTVFADGGFRPFGADFAEAVQVKGTPESYAPGDLLVIDPSGERRLSKSQIPYSTLVAGIYSTQPGVVASQHRAGDALPRNEVPLAVVGIVPCKVSAENGSVEVGDLLVASSTPGYAMKGTDRSKMLGAVVGKALEPLREGKSMVQVLVTLQ